MAFVKGIFLFYFSYFCQAELISTTQLASTNSTETTDGNLAHLVESEMKYNLYIELLSGKCLWTLKLPKNTTFEKVPLDAVLEATLVPQICQELGCGDVCHVKKEKYPSISKCFSDCFYEEGQLQNCSLKQAKDCVVISEAVCGAHMVRLSGGRHRCEGRVELWRGGQWGSVCDDEWDMQEAEVVCRQTGCGFALSVSGQGGQFPPGRGPVLLDNLNCTGAEPNLWDCPAAEEMDCGHKEDAGVVCSEMRAVRLSGGADRCSGKVEVHRNGTWGTVCDTCWNKEMASMICSMLRCGSEPLNFTQFNPPLSHNPGPLYYYHCPSRPSSLWDCREIVNKSHLCVGTKASGLICNGSSVSPFNAKTCTIGSLGFQVSTTPQSITLTTGMVTDFTTPSPAGWLSVPLLSAASVVLLLLVLLIVNTVLCCHYRNRNAFLVQKNQSNRSEPLWNSYEDSVDLPKVLTYTSCNNVPFLSRPLWMQLNVDRSTLDTDFEPFEPSFSTFRNSEKQRLDRNLLTGPLGLDSLYRDEAAENAKPRHNPVSSESDTSSEDYDDVDV